MVLCHSYYHNKYDFIKNHGKNIYIDKESSSKPDICMNILDNSLLGRYRSLKNSISEITSVYAPLDLFFNRDIGYPEFRFLDRLKFRDRFVQQNTRFNPQFVNFLLYFLRPGGRMTFTDNFIFHKNDLSHNAAVQIIKYFLGRKSRLFDVKVHYCSKIIDMRKKCVSPRERCFVSLVKKDNV
jgi:hypothetical protein